MDTKDKEYFKNINIDTTKKELLKKIMSLNEEYQRNRSKCNMQALQRMDILDNLDNQSENGNKKVLEDVEFFLRGQSNRELAETANRQLAEIIEELLPQPLQNSEKSDSEKLDGELIAQKKSVSENIEVNLDNGLSAGFTLLDLTFKANKLTKWLGNEVFDIVSNKNDNKLTEDTVKERSRIIYRLRKVFNKTGLKEEKKENILKFEISMIIKQSRDSVLADWFETTDQSDASYEQQLLNLYKELSPVFEIQSMLYEIKNQCVKNLFRLLINDKAENFPRWGFSKDERGNMVFNVDPDTVHTRYAFHIPIAEKVFNQMQIDYIQNENLEYDSSLDKSDRKRDFSSLIEISEQDVDEFIEEMKNKSFNKETLSANGKILYEFTQNCTRNSSEITILQRKVLKSMNIPCIKKLEGIIGEDKVNSLLEFKTGNISIDDKNKAKLISSKITKELEDLKDAMSKCLMKTKTIYVQKSDKLDKNASVTAILKYMKEKFHCTNIDVKEINAGEDLSKEKPGLYLDCGNISGSIILWDADKKPQKNQQKNQQRNPQKKTTKNPIVVALNANSINGEDSTVGVLNRMGIYVPEKILEYADKRYNSQAHIFDAKDGIYLSRFIKGNYLFAFAEAKHDRKILI